MLLAAFTAAAHAPVGEQILTCRCFKKRFDAGEWQTMVTGAPALVGSLVSFDCEVRQVVPYQSHTIFVAEIMGIELWASEINPLVYLDGKYHLVAPFRQTVPAAG